MRRIQFWKLDGAGNTFAAFDNRHGEWPEGEERRALIQTVCCAVRGVEADGVLMIEPPSPPPPPSALPSPSACAGAADVRMRYYNRDESEGEMCGNGARCLAQFAWMLGAASGSEIRIETMAGLQIARKGQEGGVALRMPDVSPLTNIPDLEVPGWKGPVDRVRVGVPHAVLWVENLAELDVDGIGRAVRRHPAFAPEGTNVNFAEPLSGAQNIIQVRTYERGVERETLACGTGSVGTAISAALGGRARPPVKMLVRSGEFLTIQFMLTPEGGAKDVTLEGPARILFRAEALWDPAARRLRWFQG